MLGTALLATFMIAYGRTMRTHFLMHVAIVLGLAAGLAALAAATGAAEFDVVLWGVGLISLLFFMLGRLLGRWLDRGKYE
ncbi:hypothetical protein [Sphingomonas rustica]